MLAALHAGPRRRRALRGNRRRALRAVIGGISDKALTEALNRLLGNRLVERRYFAEAPPRVDYGLTGLGRSFADGPVRALATWVTEYGDALFDAQERLVTTEDERQLSGSSPARR